MFSSSLFSFLFSLFSSLFFSPSDHDYCASVSYCSDTSVNKPVNKKKEPSSSKSSNHACSHPVCCCPSDFGCRCKTEKCKSDYCSGPSPAKSDEGYMKEEGLGAGWVVLIILLSLFCCVLYSWGLGVVYLHFSR